MAKASRWSWTENENSPRTMQLREYTLREFWEIFVDDRPFGADACFRHVNVQSKAVFSSAMTRFMDGEDEEKSVGSKFAACISGVRCGDSKGVSAPIGAAPFFGIFCSFDFCRDRQCHGTRECPQTVI